MSDEFIESLRLKFASGNGVPVDRASITRVEYDAIAGLWRDGCEMTDRWINCCQERNAAAELAAEHEAKCERLRFFVASVAELRADDPIAGADLAANARKLLEETK